MNERQIEKTFRSFEEWVRQEPKPVAVDGRINGWRALSEGLRNLLYLMGEKSNDKN